MARYRCPRCHEVTHRPELFAFCGICSAPLSAANLELEDAGDLHGAGSEAGAPAASSASAAAVAP